ncbi:MAG: carbon storage regulator CsrA [Verrucomicrobiota bacterium]|nr:carbon storage regulator CsrA [Verrucomicrobiota bacterium]MCC6820277.1 carbon storage regulator CsrA [Limisphaerales bacterium]
MLILSRKTNECIVIDGRIIVKIVRVEGEVVKVGIEAPADVPVHRQEVYEEIQRNNRAALTQGRPALPRLPGPATCKKALSGNPPAALAVRTDMEVVN